MKIKKFPQSCVLMTIGKTKLLIDPGNRKFDDSYIPEWKTADAILVTHKHGDHCHDIVIEKLGLPIYSTKEVQSQFPNLKINVVKPGDTLKIGEANILVTQAVHGFCPPMRESGAEVFGGVGYIIDDGKTKVYVTGDTLCFNNDYVVDILIAPCSGNCVTMDPLGCALFTKMVKAKKLIVVHNDFYDLPDNAEKVLKEQGIDYIIPGLCDTLDL